MLGSSLKIILQRSENLMQDQPFDLLTEYDDSKEAEEAFEKLEYYGIIGYIQKYITLKNGVYVLITSDNPTIDSSNQIGIHTLAPISYTPKLEVIKRKENDHDFDPLQRLVNRLKWIEGCKLFNGNECVCSNEGKKEIYVISKIEHSIDNANKELSIEGTMLVNVFALTRKQLEHLLDTEEYIITDTVSTHEYVIPPDWVIQAWSHDHELSTELSHRITKYLQQGYKLNKTIQHRIAELNTIRVYEKSIDKENWDIIHPNEVEDLARDNFKDVQTFINSITHDGVRFVQGSWLRLRRFDL